MAITDDPYFVSRVVDKAGARKRAVSDERPPVLAWMAVFAVNLILPVCFGIDCTLEVGRIGMFLGIILVFTLGCYLCFVSRRVVLGVVYGGWIVALSQFFVIPQFIAGLIGLAGARALGQMTGDGPGLLNSVLGGFIATVITGGILLTIAAAFGLVILSITSSRDRGTDHPSVE